MLPRSRTPVVPALAVLVSLSLAEGATAIRLERLTPESTDDAGPVWSSDPGFSPDGTKLAFTRAWYADNRFRTEITLLDLGDGSMTILPRPAQVPTDALPGQPTWSPDGRRLAYSLQKGLALVDLATNQARLVATDHGTDLAPHWSPDGNTITFQSNQRGIMDIWGYDVRTQQLTNLLAHNSVDGFPRWSPDGRSLAITSNKDGNFDIWIVPLGGGYPRRLTTDVHKDMQPDWSPDGRFIVFVSEREGSSDLWAVPVRGGEPTRLTWDDGEEVHPRWGPDGRSIAFTSNRSGSLELWLLTDLPPAELLERRFEAMARRRH